MLHRVEHLSMHAAGHWSGLTHIADSGQRQLPSKPTAPTLLQQDRLAPSASLLAELIVHSGAPVPRPTARPACTQQPPPTTYARTHLA